MRGYLLAIVVSAAQALSACGGVSYAVKIHAAEARLEEARQVGAEHAAPYEYTFAREHLRAAQIHAAEASYGDAADFAETAESFAQRAIERTTAASRAEVEP